MRPLFCSLWLVLACKSNPPAGDDSPQAEDSPQDSPTPEGPLYWDNWSCSESGDACESAYADQYVLTCVPNAGTCIYGDASGGYSANCTTWEGTGCAGCESAFESCVAPWIATLD